MVTMWTGCGSLETVCLSYLGKPEIAYISVPVCSVWL